MEKKESPQEYIKVWSSEMWHGKSLQVACIFLPEDCPLGNVLPNTYHADDFLFGPTIIVFCFGEERPLLLRKGVEGEPTYRQFSALIGDRASYEGTRPRVARRDSTARRRRHRRIRTDAGRWTRSVMRRCRRRRR